jgi:cyclopropane-fatty-acyl-phospholipid synthase
MLWAVAHPAASDHETLVARSLSLLQDALAGYEPLDFSVRCWNGATWTPCDAPRFTLVLTHPGSVRQLLWPPKLITVWDAYAFGDIEIEGDLRGLLRLAEHLGRIRRGREALRAFEARIDELPSEARPRDARHTPRLTGEPHSLERDKAAISHHYDVPPAFFELWLDPLIQYSCAYFHDPGEDLETAQARKVEYLCRKLRLKPGERLLDVGCGWGGLIRYVARHYDVETVGLSIARAQVEFTRARIAAEGLEARCRVEQVDVRELVAPAAYDAITIVGVLEHFGETAARQFFENAWTLLRPGGRLVVQTITTSVHIAPPPSWQLVHRFVFPDGHPLPLSMELQFAELAGFEVRDVESLREHYALTLEHWIRNLRRRELEARTLVDDVTYRTWLMYLVGSQVGFETGAYSLHHYLLVKPDQGRSRLPLTRRDWYPAS